MPLKEVDLKNLAERTELFSGADLESLTKEVTKLLTLNVLE
jgi:SpoVK/Ycf46/Vps4 family AAA+-type ATPase